VKNEQYHIQIFVVYTEQVNGIERKRRTGAKLQTQTICLRNLPCALLPLGNENYLPILLKSVFKFTSLKHTFEAMNSHETVKM